MQLIEEELAQATKSPNSFVVDTTRRGKKIPSWTATGINQAHRTRACPARVLAFASISFPLSIPELVVALPDDALKGDKPQRQDDDVYQVAGAFFSRSRELPLCSASPTRPAVGLARPSAARDCRGPGSEGSSRGGSQTELRD